MHPPRTFDALVAIMDRLRDPGGCPWDREQTYATLRGFLLEEAYEVAEAIDDGDPDHLREELGDLLFQVVFLSRLAKEQGRFDAADVIEGIATKMIRRHPHVFAEDSAEDAAEVLRRWEEIKKKEKADAGQAPRASLLDGLPRALPALVKAQRLGDKAARVGFDWPEAGAVIDKVHEELEELRSAVRAEDAGGAAEELGDLLFATAMLGRKLGVDPEAALEAANAKFRRRFEGVEQALRERGVPLEQAGLELMDRLWNETKRRERFEK
jgi:MazG family protein